MLKLFRILIPVVVLFLGSCFASRQTPSEPVAGPAISVTKPAIPVVDPVETALDSVWLARGKGVVRDTVLQDGADTLETAGVATEQFPLFVPDTMVVAVLEMAERPADTITIIGTGDIMPGTNYPDDSYLPPGNDCPRLFAPVAGILRSADVTFGNLEGVFSSQGGTPKNCRDPKTCYVFRMPDEYLACILDAGYNLLGVANNHVNDFGTGGRLNTARLLDEAGVPFAGFVEKPSTTFEVDGVKYGFAAFAPNLGTADLKDYAGAAGIVAALDSICDIVIVSFHGGAEGRDYQHVPCTDEVYLGHNRGNVCTFSHAVVDAGADVVFGHGPHVTRAMELYKDRLICYSLGNFCTYARFNLSGPNGYAPIVKVLTNREGKFLGGKVIPIYQARPGGPRVDTGNHAVRLLRELTMADFPDTELVILEDGTLKKR
jgi:poly-gamma-glutamate capsule biosynthesis protein CapA/YwtB (metallophosphatase superfamily)